MTWKKFILYIPFKPLHTTIRISNNIGFWLFIIDLSQKKYHITSLSSLLCDNHVSHINQNTWGKRKLEKTTFKHKEKWCLGGEGQYQQLPSVHRQGNDGWFNHGSLIVRTPFSNFRVSKRGKVGFQLFFLKRILLGK